MSKVVSFPLNINYRIYGIHRDGRIIVQILNSPKRFMMHAEHIIANRQLINNFTRKQVQWLCDVAEINNNTTRKQIV